MDRGECLVAGARTPTSVVVTVVVSLLVAVGAVAGAAVLGAHRQPAAAPTRSSTQAPSSSEPVDPSGCKRRPCKVLGTVVVAGSTVDLVADAGGTSGRLRIGGPGSGQVIETTVTNLGVKLTTSSLQCIAGPISACLIRGELHGGVAGEVVVGRSDSWSPLENRFQSDAGYLALSNVVLDASPEIVAVQHDCPGGDESCADRPVFGQVFQANGTEIGCTRQRYSAPEDMPGYPSIQLRGLTLDKC